MDVPSVGLRLSVLVRANPAYETGGFTCSLSRDVVAGLPPAAGWVVNPASQVLAHPAFVAPSGGFDHAARPGSPCKGE